MPILASGLRSCREIALDTPSKSAAADGASAGFLSELADSVGACATRAGARSRSRQRRMRLPSSGHAAVRAFPDLDGGRYNSRFAGACVALFAPARSATPMQPVVSLPRPVWPTRRRGSPYRLSSHLTGAQSGHRTVSGILRGREYRDGWRKLTTARDGVEASAQGHQGRRRRTARAGPDDGRSTSLGCSEPWRIGHGPESKSRSISGQ